MFEAGKLLWIVFAPANLFVLALLGIWLSVPRRRAPGAKRWLGLLTLAAVLIACTPLSRLPLVLLENRFARADAALLASGKIAGVIVLGGGTTPSVSLMRDEPTVTQAAPRLLAFADLARRLPDARLLFTGGAGDLFHPEASEAPVARQALQRMSLDVARVMFEDRARDTYENAVFSYAMAQPKPSENWLLVTSAAHMPRAMATFRAQGWHVVPWPVSYWTGGDLWSGWGFDLLGGLSMLQAGMREWIGLVAYYVEGRSDSLIPGPR